jgi:hypothetical protein
VVLFNSSLLTLPREHIEAIRRNRVESAKAAENNALVVNRSFAGE